MGWQNRISVIENLDFMAKLVALVLSNNAISRVQNLRHLHKVGRARLRCGGTHACCLCGCS